MSGGCITCLRAAGTASPFGGGSLMGRMNCIRCVFRTYQGFLENLLRLCRCVGSGQVRISQWAGTPHLRGDSHLLTSTKIGTGYTEASCRWSHEWWVHHAYSPQELLIPLAGGSLMGRIDCIGCVFSAPTRVFSKNSFGGVDGFGAAMCEISSGRASPTWEEKNI